MLFDGKDFSKWAGDKGGDVKWTLKDGYMETTQTGMIHTKDEFGNFQLHLEWATPAKVDPRSVRGPPTDSAPRTKISLDSSP